VNDQQFRRLIYVLLLGFGGILAWLTLGLTGLLIVGALVAAYEAWGVIWVLTHPSPLVRTVRELTKEIEDARRRAEWDAAQHTPIDPIDYPFWSVGNAAGIAVIVGGSATLLGAVAAWLVALFP
jgi:hypothetical protein